MQFQISGAPDWVKADRYDMAAKAEGDPPVRELRAMLQRLLEDRFQLKRHWDTKEAAVYDLVVSKAGKLREAEPGVCLPILSAPGSRPGGPPDDAPCGGLRNSPGQTKGYKLTTGDLAGGLSFYLGRLVLDKTGLTGKYDIDLQWSQCNCRRWGRLKRSLRAGETHGALDVHGPPGAVRPQTEIGPGSGQDSELLWSWNMRELAPWRRLSGLPLRLQGRDSSRPTSR